MRSCRIFEYYKEGNHKEKTAETEKTATDREMKVSISDNNTYESLTKNYMK